MKNDRITLVMVCDNHLVVMLSALLKSIELSHKYGEPIDIYIIDDGISGSNIKKLNQTITSNDINIVWKNIKDAIPERFALPADRSTYPLCIYVRLFLPYFLPENLSKAIYLDVDMIVLRDIQFLWNMDIADNALAAVVDISEKVGSSWGGIRNYKELGIDPEAKYFNSGLLVIDLQKWREINATQSILNIIEANQEHALYPDQYGLNVIFANKWHELDSRWNNYSQRTTPDPFIIHFTEIKPIYKRYNLNQEYKETFYKILQSTPWNGFSPQKTYMDQTQKVLNLISKGKWFVLFNKLFNIFFNKVFVNQK